MNRTEYQKFLNDTSKLIFDFLSNISKRYEEFDFLLSENFKRLYGQRLESKLLKPSIFKLIYDFAGGNNFDSVKEIAGAFELINISSYQANSSFDNKIGSYSKEQKDLQFISSYLTREIANQTILKLETEPYLKEELLKEVSTINEKIYLAQHIDLNVLTIQNLHKYKTDKKEYLKYYKMRCELGSGYFSGSCAKMACITAGNNSQSNLIFQIFNEYGTLLHMINDLGDYLPNKKYNNKIYQDNFSDFNNGRLTLPLFLMLTETNTEFSDYTIENIQNSIYPYLLSSKKFILTQYKELKKTVSLLENNEKSKMIKVLLSTIKSNKYFNQLKDDRNI